MFWWWLIINTYLAFSNVIHVISSIFWVGHKFSNIHSIVLKFTEYCLYNKTNIFHDLQLTTQIYIMPRPNAINMLCNRHVQISSSYHSSMVLCVKLFFFALRNTHRHCFVPFDRNCRVSGVQRPTNCWNSFTTLFFWEQARYTSFT